MRTTKTSTYPSSETIAAQVHAHGEEERLDNAAQTAVFALLDKLGDGADDPEPNLTAAFEQARLDGDWDAYGQTIGAHYDWEQRSKRRAYMVNTTRDRHRSIPIERRHATRAEAGRQTLDYLADALPQIIRAAQALDLTGVPATAEKALSAGKTAADKYTRAADVVAAYTTLRQAQAEAVKAVARVEMGRADDLGVFRTGQFREAMHNDATWLENRRVALMPESNTATAQRLRQQMARVPGAEEFFDGVPEPLFGPIGEDGYPVECKTVPARAVWLAKWSTRLEFWVPSFEQLRELAEVYNITMSIQAWPEQHGLTLVVGKDGRPAAGNDERVALVNPGYVRPDWDAPQDDTEAEAVADAAEANRQAARSAEHPGYAA